MATFNNHLNLSKPLRVAKPVNPLATMKRKLGLKGMGKPTVNSASGSTFRKSGLTKSMPARKTPKPRSS